MTKSNISQYDATASNNTDIDGTDIAENCSPAGINNAIRSLMSHLKQMDVGTVALTSPSASSMTVAGDLTIADKIVHSGDTNTAIRFAAADTVTVETAGSERLRIDSSGNVGINRTSPNGLLHMQSPSGTDSALFIQTSAASDDSVIHFGDDSASSVGSMLYDHSTNSMQFETNSAERMRIDSSGNVLVGTTSNDPRNFSGGTYGSLLNAGQPEFAVNAGMFINQATGSDGTLIAFRKEGSSRGKIGVTGSYPFIAGSGAGLMPRASDIVPTDGTGALSDNMEDLGDGAVRFDDVFATNGTIQTSDQNEKQQIASLTDAEITAAKAISKLFKTFKWNDSVTANGDNARTHAGVIAQEVQSAMSDAGLDATKYAFWCSDTWWETQTEVPAVEADEENGIEAKDAYTRTDTYETKDEAPEGATERTRLGIRYPELLAFIGAATEQRLADIETRLTALEG